jgi:hypothetical protein
MQATLSVRAYAAMVAGIVGLFYSNARHVERVRTTKRIVPHVF